MKAPSKKQIAMLRISLGMTGLIAINDYSAELILCIQSEVKRLGEKFSLRDAARVADELTKRHEAKQTKNVKV